MDKVQFKKYRNVKSANFLPTLAAATAAAKSLQSCPTLRPHRWQPTRVPHPWDSPGKNTGVGCHFLLQCLTVNSEREVAQSCLTLCDPMNCSLPGSSVHGIFQARILECTGGSFRMAEAKEWVQNGIRIKSESEVAQSCPTLSDPMDCSPPGPPSCLLMQETQETWV